MKLWTLLLLFHFTYEAVGQSDEILDVSDEIDIPPDKEECMCSWSGWMNSSGVADDSSEDETYTKLRKNSFEFCKSPVDIQCYNHEFDRLVGSPSNIICDVNLGAKCTFLCDDVSIRVACCYCPPDTIGPEFLIGSRSSSGGCLSAPPYRNISAVVVADKCDIHNKNQLWAWVSSKSIKNIETQQCLALVDNVVALRNCDTGARTQKWKYIDRNSLIQIYDRSGSYLRKSGDSVAMMSSRDQDSKWIARVAEGETGLKNMRYPKCASLTKPTDGNYSCTLGDHVSSECTFTCNYGYRLPENAPVRSECTEDGFYPDEPASCERIECLPSVDTVEHGSMTCSKKNRLDSVCTFSCGEGYALIGSHEITCGQDGEWNQPMPVCKRVRCEPDLKNSGIENGSVNCTDGVYHRSKCSYTCQEGFEMVGNEITTCQIDETWDQSKPVCSKIQCPAIVASKHSLMSCTKGNDYASVCEFSCSEGYDMIGTPTATCAESKLWSSDVPKCERKTCNPLESPENGDMSCNDSYFYDSRCSFTCDRGYNLEGERSLKCTGEGWNFGAPTCKQITCNRIGNVVNGNLNCSHGEVYGSKCSFSCDLGYSLNGDESIQCINTGWSKAIPTCKQITCPAISNPRNGNVICSYGNAYGSACYLMCQTGFTVSNRLQGVPIMCQIDGTWSVAIENLHCKKFQCRPITVSQGLMSCSSLEFEFNSSCSFSCKDGYNLLGSPETVCTMNGWSAQSPTCSRQTCSPPLARPSNGKIKCESDGPPVCTFSCVKGYELSGESVSRCQADEKWSVEEIPICSIVRCPRDPEIPRHGNMTCAGKTYESACRFKCEIGYNLVGSETTTCTELRTWDQESPACQKISCPALEKLEFGKVTCSENYNYKSECQFECDNGYKLLGNAKLQCRHNATWDVSPPYCERITCATSFSNPSNGRVQCTDENNYKSVCSFSCEDGFYLEGSERSKCTEKGWTKESAPMCKQITCPLEAEGIPNGARACDRSNSYKSMCSYSCNNGYELKGSHIINCTNSGTWSSETPKCTEIRCPEIPEIQHGLVKCDKANLYNSECEFRCDEGFHKSDGVRTVTCMANQRWRPAGFPTCEPDNATVLSTLKSTTTTTTVKPSTAAASTETPTTPATRTTTLTSMPTTTSTTEAATSPKSTAQTTVAKPMTIKPPLDLWSTRKAPTTTTITTSTTAKPKSTDGLTFADSGKDKSTAEIPQFVFIAIGVAVVVVLVAIILIVLWRKKSRQKTKYRNGSLAPYKVSNRADHTELGPLIPNGHNTGPKKFGSISMDRLEMEYNRKHADDDKLFREEYHALADGAGSKEAGCRAKNKNKNRYTNILPFDHSRVILPKVGIDADSDYINASFVDGYKHKGKFIAAQGPKENTIDDFWRMIWEQNVSTVVMATNLEERKELKCAKYWPSGTSENYGELMVHFLGENHLVDFTIRKFTIQRVAGNVEASLSVKRNVTQYHFTSWPDFGVPKSPSGILKFLRKIKHSSPAGFGPIVVHCSAGVGRTGTFICIDGMMDMISRENKIDVFSFSSQMRQQRPEMVQTEQQYIFIYQAILEHHLYGDTEVEASEVSAHIEELMQRLPGNVTGMEHEFKKLTSIRIQKEHMRAGNHPANMRKNRVLLIFPYDWNRVMLPMKRGQENTDYINASYIDGYRQKDAYVATQGPLPHTTEDFWRMIWHYECASIVMLTETVERGQVKCAQYWPNEGVSTFGDIDVQLVTSYENEYYTERDFKVTNLSSTDRKELIVKQFHYHDWPEVGAPVSGYSMIELVDAVQKQQQNSGNHPIVVHCSAGGGRTGAFCALSTALEQVKAEGVLDMFQIVKCLRMQRPHMVQDLDQYEFCYRAVQEYIDSMSEYYNFK